MKRIYYLTFFAFIFLNASAQADSARHLWLKHKIWIYSNDGDPQNGILISTTDTSLKYFPGKFSDWNNRSEISAVNLSYLNINNIKTHKKNGLMRGIVIGAGIGLSPILFGAIFGEGQGGGYVSVITFPVGIITGAIIGSTAKKKFFIGGQASKFHSFHKRMKY